VRGRGLGGLLVSRLRCGLAGLSHCVRAGERGEAVEGHSRCERKGWCVVRRSRVDGPAAARIFPVEGQGEEVLVECGLVF